MFIAIYEFELKSLENEASFKEAWRAITQLMLEHANSLGSRLHRQDELTFIAYAQWPDRQHWENARNKLPDVVETYRSQMRNSCKHVKTLHELEIEHGFDLLRKN